MSSLAWSTNVTSLYTMMFIMTLNTTSISCSSLTGDTKMAQDHTKHDTHLNILLLPVLRPSIQIRKNSQKTFNRGKTKDQQRQTIEEEEVNRSYT